MAPQYTGKMGYVNGKLVTLRIKDKTKVSVGWTKWEDTKSEDWACHICDNFIDNASDSYLGNYASDKSCRTCNTPKRGLSTYVHVYPNLAQTTRHLKIARRN